ncbi:hypothetical protein J1N35_038852 [Gossypium stocksii]|uniref:2Fe-2S ferredoxin-type domain-containing protein n=1 Tax=Gossypium stocksii TaxID=47602 RepID=A0A9D3UMW7_9ROSI|nr:hypothetical protein J1N35_038852 [Gossypium stocksii]
MGTLQLSIHGLATTSSVPRKFNFRSRSSNTHLRFSTPKICAVSTVPDSESTAKDKEPDEPPAVDFAFVHVSLKVIVYANASSTWIYNLMGNFAVFFQSVLLPDGTPDVHFRRACGGQKLRDIMLDNNMELYGPYGRPLLNCAGGGTCGTCMVEVNPILFYNINVIFISSKPRKKQLSISVLDTYLFVFNIHLWNNS